MSRPSRIRTLVLLVCIVCLIVVVLGWWLVFGVADAQFSYDAAFPHTPQPSPSLNGGRNARQVDPTYAAGDAAFRNGGADGGSVVVPALHVLRNVLLFGDSLTAGAFYEERSGRLVLRTVNWARTVEEELCVMYRNHIAQHHLKRQRPEELGLGGSTAAPFMCNIHVVARGFPGKNSKALALKLRRILLKERQRHHRPDLSREAGIAPHYPAFSVVVIMSGTNDVVGLRNTLTTADIIDMHRLVRLVNCVGSDERVCDGIVDNRGTTCMRSNRSTTFPPSSNGGSGGSVSHSCGSVALLTPPINYSLTREWYGQRLPRGYCEGKSAAPAVADALHRRRTTLNALIATDSWLSTCAYDWDVHGLSHRDRADVRAMWSDCLHPNADGYRRLGRMVAQHLWTLVVGGGRMC